MRTEHEGGLGLTLEVGPGVAGLVDLRREPDLGDQLPEQSARLPPALPPAEPLGAVRPSRAALKLAEVRDHPRRVDLRPAAQSFGRCHLHRRRCYGAGTEAISSLAAPANRPGPSAPPKACPAPLSTNSMYQPEGTRPALWGIVTLIPSSVRVKLEGDRALLDVGDVGDGAGADQAGGLDRARVGGARSVAVPPRRTSCGPPVMLGAVVGVEVGRRVDLDPLLEGARDRVVGVGVERVAAQRDHPPVGQQQRRGVVVAPDASGRRPGCSVLVFGS